MLRSLQGEGRSDNARFTGLQTTRPPAGYYCAAACSSNMWPLSTFAQPAVLTLSTFLQRRVLTHNSAVSLQQSRLSDFRGQVAPPLDGGPPSSSFLRCDIDKISPSLFTPPPFLIIIIIRTNTCSDSTHLLQIVWQHFLCLISFRHT